MSHRAPRALAIPRSLIARLAAPAAGRSALRHQPPRFARLLVAVAATATVLVVALPAPAAAAGAAIGYDVSWPNCSQTAPVGAALSVVGVTGGKAFTTNPCFRAEYLAGLRTTGSVRFYMNLNSPTGTIGMSGPAGRCSAANLSCQAYNYGYRAAAAAWAYAASQIGTAPLATRWWLDVELMNSWSSNTALNDRVVAGALGFLGRPGHANRLGIYSTNYQWRAIAGGYRPGIATWYATVVHSAITASGYCRAGYAFAGGAVAMVQYLLPGGIDRDYICS